MHKGSTNGLYYGKIEKRYIIHIDNHLDFQKEIQIYACTYPFGIANLNCKVAFCL
jgi:hypothetical protein